VELVVGAGGGVDVVVGACRVVVGVVVGSVAGVEEVVGTSVGFADVVVVGTSAVVVVGCGASLVGVFVGDDEVVADDEVVVTAVGAGAGATTTDEEGTGVVLGAAELVGGRHVRRRTLRERRRCNDLSMRTGFMTAGAAWRAATA